MAAWFKKYDLHTLKSPHFLSEFPQILSQIPQLSSIEAISEPEDPRYQNWDQQISLSLIDFENLLQKTLIRIVNLMLNFFKSEYFVQESETDRDFCTRAFGALSVERRYCTQLWTKQNAVHANFIMNRIMASFIRLMFLFQDLQGFILNGNETISFLEAETSGTRLTWDNVFAVVDCLTLVMTALLQRLSHLRDFLNNEINFLLRVYFFLAYFKTTNWKQNLSMAKQKFNDKDLESMVYLLLDTTKTAVVINRGLLSSSKVVELEPEFEEDPSPPSRHYEGKDVLINGSVLESPTEKSPQMRSDSLIETNKLVRQRTTNVGKVGKLVKNNSVFFDELNENDEIREEKLEEINSLGIKKAKSGKLRKSLIGDTRNSLIAELIATTGGLGSDENMRKPSRFAELLAVEKPQESLPEIIEAAVQLRSGIVRNLESGGGNQGFWSYLNTINPNLRVTSPRNDKDSVMNSQFFKNSMNLPMKTVLSTVHPSILYYKAGHNEQEKEREESPLLGSKSAGVKGMGESAMNPNLIKSMSSYRLRSQYEPSSYNYNYEDVPRNQKFEAINENLNENLVKYLLDYGKKEAEKDKDDKDGKGAKLSKKDFKEKKMNQFMKELEGDNIMSTTKGDEDSPKNGRRTLSGKKDNALKKQNTLDKEKEDESCQVNKHKRRSNKQGTKKLGITEKDLIKIDKNTPIDEKLEYNTYNEKLEEDIANDEDILITTLSSEADELKKKVSVVTNTFVRSILKETGRFGRPNISTLRSQEDNNRGGMTQPSYKVGEGVMIPFFIKKEDDDEGIEELEVPGRVKMIAEEVLNDLEVCDEYSNEFFVARKKPKRLEISERKAGGRDNSQTRSKSNSSHRN